MLPQKYIIICLLAVLSAPSSHVQASASPIALGTEEENVPPQLQPSLRGLLSAAGLANPQTVVLKSPSATDPMNEMILTSDEGACCVPCTTPANTCCLKCSAVSSYREHDLLMASMEGLSTYLMDKHAGAKDHDFLKNRSWEGNSHIGNRPMQATYYYDWIRSLDNVQHVCEIGLNGGHSAVIFLAGLVGREGVKLTMFDLMMWDYSPTAAKYVDALYPGKMTVIEGNSRKLVPQWTNQNQQDKCDVFSVDGGHRYFEAHADILNAAKATKKGGIILLDDMNPGSKTRKAFDDALADGILANAHCVENVVQRVGYVDRVDETNAREMLMSWCMAIVV